jgi:S1-C subfamily serine protease
MSALTQLLLGAVTLAAPMPKEAMPDPLARGYLGIIVEAGTLMIKDVEPSTPAAKAGLRSGDTIARVGTLQPEAFEQVVNLICNYRPGTQIEIEVRRGNDTHTLLVRLAARPEKLGPPPSVMEQLPLAPDQ